MQMSDIPGGRPSASAFTNIRILSEQGYMGWVLDLRQRNGARRAAPSDTRSHALAAQTLRRLDLQNDQETECMDTSELMLTQSNLVRNRSATRDDDGRRLHTAEPKRITMLDVWLAQGH
jgi:hypothetical protein